MNTGMIQADLKTEFVKPHLVSFVENGNRVYMRPDQIRLAIAACKDDGTPALRIEFESMECPVFMLISDAAEWAEAEQALEQLACAAVIFSSEGSERCS